MVSCRDCPKVFSSKSNMRRHTATCHEKTEQLRYICPYCTKTRGRREDLIRYHIVDEHPERLPEVQKNPKLILSVTEREETEAKRRKIEIRKEDKGKTPKKIETEVQTNESRKNESRITKEEETELQGTKRKIDDKEYQENHDTRVVREVKTIENEQDSKLKKTDLTENNPSVKPIGTPMSPLPNKSPTLFNNLDRMLAGVDRPATPNPKPQTPNPQPPTPNRF